LIRLRAPQMSNEPASEGSFLKGFLRLRENLAPRREVGTYGKSWRLGTKLAPS
jgi:hypothetical protein